MTEIIQRADAKTIARVAPHLPANVVEAMATSARNAERQFGGAAWRLDQKRIKHGDAALLPLAQRQLEEVLQSETVNRPTLSLFRMFNGLIQAGEQGADSYVQRIYDHSGDVQYTAQRGSSQVPNVSFSGSEKRKPYHEMRADFEWDVSEAEAAARGDFSLLTEARQAAQRYHEIEWNRSFFYGRSDLDLDGVVNFPNRLNEQAAAQIDAGSPDDAAELLFQLTDTMKQETEGAFDVSDVMLSDFVYDYVSRTRMTDGDSNSVLSYVQSMRGGVTFHRVIELGAQYRSNDRNAAVIGNTVKNTFGVAFSRETFRFMSGMSFQVTAPVQVDPYKLRFGTRSRIGGIRSLKPLGIYTLQNMAA